MKVLDFVKLTSVNKDVQEKIEIAEKVIDFIKKNLDENIQEKQIYSIRKELALFIEENDPIVLQKAASHFVHRQ